MPDKPKREPYAYAYPYANCIRFNHGQMVNGGNPIEVIPLFTQADLDACAAAKDEEIGKLRAKLEELAAKWFDGEQPGPSEAKEGSA
jgi:hypothetical protein